MDKRIRCEKALRTHVVSKIVSDSIATDVMTKTAPEQFLEERLADNDHASATAIDRNRLKRPNQPNLTNLTHADRELIATDVTSVLPTTDAVFDRPFRATDDAFDKGPWSKCVSLEFARVV